MQPLVLTQRPSIPFHRLLGHTLVTRGGARDLVGPERPYGEAIDGAWRAQS